MLLNLLSFYQLTQLKKCCFYIFFNQTDSISVEQWKRVSNVEPTNKVIGNILNLIIMNSLDYCVLIKLNLPEKCFLKTKIS